MQTYKVSLDNYGIVTEKEIKAENLQNLRLRIIKDKMLGFPNALISMSTKAWIYKNGKLIGSLNRLYANEEYSYWSRDHGHYNVNPKTGAITPMVKKTKPRRK